MPIVGGPACEACRLFVEAERVDEVRLDRAGMLDCPPERDWAIQGWRIA